MSKLAGLPGTVTTEELAGATTLPTAKLPGPQPSHQAAATSRLTRFICSLQISGGASHSWNDLAGIEPGTYCKWGTVKRNALPTAPLSRVGRQPLTGMHMPRTLSVLTVPPLCFTRQ